MQDLRVVVSCRACLFNNNLEQEFFPLFSTIPNCESTLKLADLFKTISGLNVRLKLFKSCPKRVKVFDFKVYQNDKLSQTLCNSCVGTMVQFYKFRLMCNRNNRRFRPTKANLGQNEEIKVVAENHLMQDGLRYVDVDNFVVQSSQSKDTKEDNGTNLDLQNITDNVSPVKASHIKQLSI